MNKEKRKALVIGLIYGGGVFIAGYFVLLIMWIVGDYPLYLRGFFYYKAATIGDGICLPVMIFSLTAFNHYRISKYQIKPNKNISYMSILALLIGGGIQISWLLDSNIIPNWTLPFAGHFNFPGWYHAIFFAGMFGISTYCILTAFVLLRQKSADNGLYEQQLFFGFISSGCLYLLLHFGDDYGKQISYQLLFFAIVIVVFMIFGGELYFMENKNNRKLLPMLVTGLLLAFGVALIVFNPPRSGQVFLSLGGAFCACLLWNETKIEQLVTITLESVIAFFICFLCGFC